MWVEREESVRSERSCETLGILRRRRLRGCFALSRERAVVVVVALVWEALPETSLATVELAARLCEARVCFHAYGSFREDDVDDEAVDDEVVAGILLAMVVARGISSVAATRAADSAALRALRLRDWGKLSELVSI